MNRRNALLSTGTAVALTVTTALLQGCATPVGGPFDASIQPKQGQANVYLYRRSVLYASGQSFTAQLGKQPAEELANGSFLLMTTPAGPQTLSVKPGAIAKSYEQTWEAVEGRTYYFEFVLPSYLLGNIVHLGSDLAVRSEAVAQRDMKLLQGMK